MTAQHDGPFVFVAVDIQEVATVRRPHRLELVAIDGANSPGQASGKIKLPKIKTRISSSRRIHDAFAIRVPVGILIEILSIADVDRAAIVKTKFPELVVASGFGLVHD